MPSTYKPKPKPLSQEELSLKQILNGDSYVNRIVRSGPSDLLFEVLWGPNQNLINFLNHNCLQRLREATQDNSCDLMYQRGERDLATARAVFLLFLNVDTELKELVLEGKSRIIQAGPYNKLAAELFFEELRQIVTNWLKMETKSVLVLIDEAQEAYIHS